jgi:hypothetical protein
MARVFQDNCGIGSDSKVANDQRLLGLNLVQRSVSIPKLSVTLSGTMLRDRRERRRFQANQCLALGETLNAVWAEERAQLLLVHVRAIRGWPHSIFQ